MGVKCSYAAKRKAFFVATEQKWTAYEDIGKAVARTPMERESSADKYL
jgi:hypothetical protein